MVVSEYTDSKNGDMIMNYGRTIDLLHRSLDTELLRQDVIANNIANSDTPNFKRSEVNFESELRRALRNEQAPRFIAARTDEEHIPFRRLRRYDEVQPVRRLDYQTTVKNNDNNVDIEVESANLLRSRLAYSLYTNSVSQMYGRIAVVLR